MTLQSFMIIAQLQMYIFAIGALLTLFKYDVKDIYIKVLGVVLMTSILLEFTTNLLLDTQVILIISLIVKVLKSFLIVSVFYLHTRFQPRDAYIKIIGLLLLSSIFADFAAGVLHELKISVNYAASFYNIISFPLISLLYYYSMGSRQRVGFMGISIIYLAFAFANVLFIQKSTINTYTLVLSSIFVIVFCLNYFFWLLRELPTAQLQRLPMFWINSAFIIYFSGNLFLFLFTSYLVHVLNNNLLVYWTIHNILGIIEGLMIVIALWLDLQNIKSPS